jgi:hypothetical protein
MPYTFLIDNKDNVIRETWTGTLDLEQLMESCYAEWAHPDYRQGMAILSDFREARGKMSVDDVLKFASWFTIDNAPSRVAIVVRRERTLDFAGMFSLIQESDNRENCQTRMFFSYFEANAWVTSGSSQAPVQRQVEDESSQIASGEG